ncbi:MAG: tetratricopeptide repeat protein [Planctomycetota bacterium]
MRERSCVGGRQGLLCRGLLILALSSSACGSPGRGPAVPTHSREEALAATRVEDWSQAASLWHALFLADPKRPVEACREAARALIRLEDPESAAKLLDLGLGAHPEDPELLTLKGEALVALGFRRAAEESYERALRVDPRRVDALIALGRLRIDLGLESSAVEPLQRAVDITGGNFETLRLLAKAQRESGLAPKAYASWVKAFSMGPGTVDDLVEAATLFLDDSFRKAHPESGEQMCTWLRTAAVRDPQCVRAHFQLGVLCEEMGRREEAIEHYRRAVEIDPGCLMALTNLAILYSNHGDELNAREMVVRALALEQDGNRRRALQKLLEPFEKNDETP